MRRSVLTAFDRTCFAILGFFLSIVAVSAQSDNFDSGTLSPEWRRSHFNPALVNISFPDSGSGKAMRIQASPVPDVAPAAAMFYRDEIYTNFYVAVDIVDWPGTDKNQAIVLAARASLSPNPATTTGIILNYDASQYGENPGDRRQGQLQINMVTNEPAFGTKTLAVAECTFEPGRSYRLIFRGVGSHYTAQAYDLTDLTRPIVTLEADDDIQGPLPGGGSIIFENGGFKNGGVCGFLSFSRQGTAGTTDVTIDNYYAGPDAPAVAAGTALPHPVAGTPVVETRVPAERFKNFHNPADGISFTVNTHGTNLVDAAGIKLRLNGVDVSGQLILPPNGTNISVSLPGSSLTPNTVYTGQIEVVDVGGTLRSTNLFWFDTFSEAYLTNASVKVIEAEEYNYSLGQFQPDPIPVSGYDTNGLGVNGGGVGYLEQVGEPEIDYHDARFVPEGSWAAEFRSLDPVGLSAGMFPEISDLNENTTPVRRSDYVRSHHAAAGLLEYVVHRTEPGEWLNYTRVFEGTNDNYRAWLRVASFGATEVELHEVTSSAAEPDQTTRKLGTFRIPNMITRYNYRYVPLVDDQGTAATLNLSGTNTLRLQMAGTAGNDVRKIAINYLLLAPVEAAGDPEVKLFASPTVQGPYAEEASATIDASAGRITIPIEGNARFFRVMADSPVRIVSTTVSGDTLTLSYERQ